jgi:hypothetical protein
VDRLYINPIALVAERKILEAIENGEFDDLPGKGKPLPEDEFANLPDEVRLCARILKSSSHLEGREGDLPAVSVAGLLEAAGEGGALNAFKGAERLGLSLRDRSSRSRKRTRETSDPSALPEPPGGPRAEKLINSPYIERILSRIF